jgi:hypothetical protein
LRSRHGNRTRRMGREMIFAMRRVCRGRSQRLCAERSEVSVFLCRFSAGCFARRGAERLNRAFSGLSGGAKRPACAAVKRPRKQEIAENPDEPVCYRRITGGHPN